MQRIRRKAGTAERGGTPQGGRERRMNYREATEYIEELQQYGSVLGLDTMRELCERLGNPQDQLRFVHIAGTNGKGSVLAYLSTILKEAGYRVGRYLSPTITDYRERFQVDGKMITQSGLCKYLSEVKDAAEAMAAEGKPHPTPFEVETAVAFLFFLDRKCDIVVLETGLGGSLDATNVVRTTVAAVFTQISRDHMGILGSSLHEIALAKAGIMKEKCYVVTAKQDPEAAKILRQAALLKKCRLYTADAERAKQVFYGVTKQRFSYGGYRNLEISLLGRFQIENAVLAVETIQILTKAGFPVAEEALRRGLIQTSWPGRFSVLSKKPLFIADGAHNEDASRRLAESIQFYFADKKLIFLLGVLKDKEYEKIIDNTCYMAEHIITLTPPIRERALPAYELAQAVRERCADSRVTAADSVQEAVEIAHLLAGQEKDAVIVAFGSLSYLGELMEIVRRREVIGRDSHGVSR